MEEWREAIPHFLGDLTPRLGSSEPVRVWTFVEVGPVIQSRERTRRLPVQRVVCVRVVRPISYPQRAVVPGYLTRKSASSHRHDHQPLQAVRLVTIVSIRSSLWFESVSISVRIA